MTNVVAELLNVPAMGALVDVLSPSHRRELEKLSVIDPKVIAERGYRTVHASSGRTELAALGINVNDKANFPGLLLPMYRATGECLSAQFKPVKPLSIKGRPVKYLSSRGRPNTLDVHPRNQGRVKDVNVPLWITEGIKKSDSLTSHDCCVVGLTGVFNWRNRLGTLGDWEDVPLKGRDVVLCFDADARTNMNVALAMVRLGHWCKSKGAKVVRYLIVPPQFNGADTKGCDDYLAAGGTLADLMQAATSQEPETETSDDTFSDSRLAERIADEVMTDQFVWCKALGWLAWAGQRWEQATEEAVGEALRLFVLKQFEKSATGTNKVATKGWYSMLSIGRQRAVLNLARGIVERNAADFDADPDLLNTPDGVVDLRTGGLSPHDPGLLFTKITLGRYRPGYTHPDWIQALTAVREDARVWFQVRVGQAVTGWPTRDGIIPVMQGGGENGKSALTTDGIVPAMGDYAAPASPKLITGSKSDHSTERADLRGQRFLIAEELTEDRSLNVTAIKQITDVGRIRARYVFKDNFTFPATHSLFVTTNYIPVVAETDHGTWRRLALIVCPYTFRKAGEALNAVTDRPGDPRLKERLRRGSSGQHDAIVTWAVEGALIWHQQNFPPLPESVARDTRQWRLQADRILGFWDECLVAAPDRCILTTELVSAFNAWMKTHGHHEWSRELFQGRFKGHSETLRHRVAEQRTRKPVGLSRSPAGPWGELPKQPIIHVGVRFREPGETDEIPGETAGCAGCADHPGTSRKSPVLEEVSPSAAHPAQTCCEGDALKLSCKLCPKSPTYCVPPK